MDRNPYIPSERRQDVEHKEQFNEEAAKRRFAERKAHIRQNTKKDVRGEFDQPGENSPSTSEKAESG
jgi:hypothetical protein